MLAWCPMGVIWHQTDSWWWPSTKTGDTRLVGCTLRLWLAHQQRAAHRPTLTTKGTLRRGKGTLIGAFLGWSRNRWIRRGEEWREGETVTETEMTGNLCLFERTNEEWIRSGSHTDRRKRTVEGKEGGGERRGNWPKYCDRRERPEMDGEIGRNPLKTSREGPNRRKGRRERTLNKI